MFLLSISLVQVTPSICVGSPLPNSSCTARNHLGSHSRGWRTYSSFRHSCHLDVNIRQCCGTYRILISPLTLVCPPPIPQDVSRFQVSTPPQASVFLYPNQASFPVQPLAPHLLSLLASGMARVARPALPQRNLSRTRCTATHERHQYKARDHHIPCMCS